MRIIVALSLGLVVGSALANNGFRRTSATEKGSIVVFPSVVIRYNPAGALIEDTFITLANDYNQPVNVRLFFVAENCTRFDVQITLTANEPAYWSILTGLPKGVSPWTILGAPYIEEPGNPASDTVIKGYIIGWAEDPNGNPIRWNHLYGTATTVNYGFQDVRSYNAYTFAAQNTTMPALQNGVIQLPLDGTVYDAGYAYLLMNFFACESRPLSNAGRTIVNETLLALMILTQDLTQDTEGPPITKAYFDIWNQNEIGFSGTEYCITKWDQSWIQDKGVTFMGIYLQTNLGRARITGIGSPVVCDPNSTGYSLLGIETQWLTFNNGHVATADLNLYGAGTQSAYIRYDHTPVIPTQERPGASTGAFRPIPAQSFDRANSTAAMPGK